MSADKISGAGRCSKPDAGFSPDANLSPDTRSNACPDANVRRFDPENPRKYDFSDFLDIIAALRAPDGCPWDIKQTHESLKECLVEESGEVIAAIDNRDDANLCEELGDLLLQVVMHAQIAAERGSFTMDDVIQGVSEKMIRRHPHVFGDVKVTSQEESLALWKQIKEKEKERAGK